MLKAVGTSAALGLLIAAAGAIGFALLGEIPCLHDLVIVPGFWDHLQPCAKLTILFFAATSLMILSLRKFGMNAESDVGDKSVFDHLKRQQQAQSL